MSEVKKILIVDDHQMFIDGIKSLLRQEKNFQIIAQALNAEDALEIIKSNPPEIVLTDISMPGMSGIELTKIIKTDYPQIKVIVLSMHNDREIVSEIMMSEAEGYILKNTGKKELKEALEHIAADGTFYSKEVLSTMMEKVKREKKTAEQTAVLTVRELEVLQLICEECSSEKIAEKLFISKRTVDTHRQNIMEKTKSKTPIGLIKFALRNDLANI
ncbi:MAG: response regulator transcription factor [Bacteroidota bacterium]|nr:response regulator transcription factor [Bacteroidota bacterium]